MVGTGVQEGQIVPERALSCKELAELITDYLEGRLSRVDANRFEAHLAICPACVTYVEQMQDAVAMVGKLPKVELSEDLESGLMDAFRNWKRSD